MLRFPLFLLIVLVAMVSCQRAGGPARNPLEGVWKIVEIKTAGPEGEATNSDPQPNLYIFTATHYSMVWVPGRETRKPSAKTWFPTNDEKVKDFDTIIVNSGTYELTDTLLTVRPTAAKTPEYVGGRGIYEYRVEADTLWLNLVDLYSSDEVQDPYVLYYRNPLKLVRVE